MCEQGVSIIFYSILAVVLIVVVILYKNHLDRDDCKLSNEDTEDGENGTWVEFDPGSLNISQFKFSDLTDEEIIEVIEARKFAFEEALRASIRNVKLTAAAIGYVNGYYSDECSVVSPDVNFEEGNYQLLSKTMKKEYVLSLINTILKDEPYMVTEVSHTTYMTSTESGLVVTFILGLEIPPLSNAT